MKKNVIITAVTAAVMMLLAGVLRYTVINMEQNEKVVSIGFIYDDELPSMVGYPIKLQSPPKR